YNDDTNWDDNVLYIENYLISAKTDISGEYTIKSGTSVINDYAFSGCTSLTGVVIPDSVINISCNMFYKCTALTDIEIGNSVESIGDYAFYNCTGLTSIVIPDSLTEIGYYTFYGCSSLENITLSDNLISIDEYAFYGTAYYKDENNWEDDVLYIGNCLIKANTSISEEYEIKDGTITIACKAFGYCESLYYITIPDSVKNIGAEAFNGCGSLYIYVDENNEYYSDIDGVLFNKDKTKIISYSQYNLEESYEIPDGVEIIEDYAFYGGGLTDITIPDSVIRIGICEFEYCSF
ncbi:MAG: leucine-rich repeat domain-containing protein, partial [Firmicutes bacterium]|nr:leucine-rich repeat domain-containing protein [Bacillota bacterium]